MNLKVCAAHIWFKVKKYNEKTYVLPTHPVVLQVSISKFSPLQKPSGVVGGGLEQLRVRIRKPTPQLWLQELQLLQSDHALTPNKDCGEKSMQTYLSRPWFFPCKKIQDNLEFWTPRRGFWIPGTGFQSLSVKLRFWIPIVSGIPDSKFQDFGFHKQNFPECQIYTSKNVPDSGTRIPLRGATWFKMVQRFSVSDIFSLFGI